ncbi:MAG: hypothetical protein KC912_19310 [Proteobacteria bacterium]|nr:hypothetical protein [Pseudomonadota bacterium]
MNKLTLVMVAAMSVLAACEGEVDGPTGDTAAAPYDGPWQVAEVLWDCDATGYTYDVKTDGWAGDMTLDIFETGAWTGTNNADVWDEFHPMSNVEFAQDGSWDTWDLELTSVATTGEVTSGTSTLFQCFQTDGTTPRHDDASLTWKAEMLDDNDALMDCAIWGHEAEDYWETNQGDDCYCFGTGCTN